MADSTGRTAQEVYGSCAEPGVVVIGAGFAGLAMGIRLKQAGRHDFVILERAADLGGTWRENRYPGCACDVPSYLYAYSFAPNPHWSRVYAERQEIHAYLRRTARSYGLERHLRFGRDVESLAYDDAARRWLVTTTRGERLRPRVVVCGVGALNEPARPDLEGLAAFRGRTLHTATWDESYDPTGDRVAVIGTGASAVQLVPAIAGRVARLTVFQRTPTWVLPRPDARVPPVLRRALARTPVALTAVRRLAYGALEAQALVHPVTARLARRQLRRQVPDAALRARLTPGTPLAGAGRVPLSSTYLPALVSPRVRVVTDPVREVRGHTVVDASGAAHRVDTLVLATGYRPGAALARLRISGRHGVRLEEAWAAGPRTHLGIAVPGFPNLFLLFGPGTGVVHGSNVFMIEQQVEHVLACLRRVEARAGSAIEAARATAAEGWLWPGSSSGYRRATRKSSPYDYTVY
ncbi:hypothetical protein AV521_43865 [Streptomyces sp. IMTB 2501]|uniref:flavin-containing monooxygenase n=1 Tax=Streptomyces sp. IMTB 2501 TaxID=1776340 RepID=UPI00096C4E56|nr:NAD(P)/FAD-dependent oxidoreductase [Streptomyces sp. IMTB 2501]OLZ61271.1 hypothetical protein AV521_43865 [Streptomyces sp. IMTB 2501]